MRRHLFLVLGIVAGLAVGAGGAVAATGGGSDKPAESAGGSSEAIGGASSTARLALMVNGEPFAPGGGPDFNVIRSKGVQSVTNPTEGWWCVRPTSAIPAAQISRLVVSVESLYTGSATYENWAQYVSPRFGCPAGTISIATFSADATGALDTADNDVAFSVVID